MTPEVAEAVSGKVNGLVAAYLSNREVGRCYSLLRHDSLTLTAKLTSGDEAIHANR